jgi:hypothetical protein
METTPTLIAVPWKPSRSTGIWMNVLSTLVAVVAGYLAFVIAFGAGIAGKVLPYFYCTAVGQRYSVDQDLVEDMKDGLIIYKPAT